MTEQTGNEHKLETEEKIREIESVMATVPVEWNKYICLTALNEDEVKVYFDIPECWIYKEFSTVDKVRIALLYFDRKKYKRLLVNFEGANPGRKIICCFASEKVFR
jgi:hypothetical protein